MFGVIIQNLCEITVLAEKAGIPRHVFLECINDSVLGSMYTRYKTPVVCNLDFDHVTFTPKLLLKDMDLGLRSGRSLGVPMPTAAATRDSMPGDRRPWARQRRLLSAPASSRHGTPASSSSPRT